MNNQQITAYYAKAYGEATYSCNYKASKHYEIVGKPDSSVEIVQRILSPNSSYFEFLKSNQGTRMLKEIAFEEVREGLLDSAKYLEGRYLKVHFCDVGSSGAENPDPKSKLEILLKPVGESQVGFYSAEYGLTGIAAEFRLLMGSKMSVDLTRNLKVQAEYERLSEELLGFLTNWVFDSRSGVS